MVVCVFILGVYLSSAILAPLELTEFVKRLVQMTVSYALIGLYILFRLLKKRERFFAALIKDCQRLQSAWRGKGAGLFFL